MSLLSVFLPLADRRAPLVRRGSLVAAFTLAMGVSPTGWAQPATVRDGLVSTATTAASAASTPSANAQDTTTSDSQPTLNALSDAELTDMAADWDALDDTQRAQLIQETRERMAPEPRSNGALGSAARSGVPTPQRASSLQQKGRKSNGLQQTAPQQAVPQQRAAQQRAPQRIERRRYGRIVRKPDGSVVRIETQVVRVQRADPTRAYGMGFERRHGQPSAEQSAPARQSAPTQGMPVQGVPVVPVLKAAAPERSDVIAVQGSSH